MWIALTVLFDLDELEDQYLFDVAFCHEMGSTQGDVVTRSDGKRGNGWVCFVSEVEKGL